MESSAQKVFKKVNRQPLSELIATEIEEAIISGKFSAGSQLPSEQELATQFGVSRNVVREAFKYLKERGLITILNGSGAYVCEPSTEATSMALGRYLRFIGAEDSIGGLYEARRVLEGANVRLAAERATPKDIETLEMYLNRMEAHEGSIEKWSEADLAFHLAIAQATQNPLMSVLLEPLVDQVRGVIAEGYLVPGAKEGGLKAHRKLLECIRNRDADGAYQALMEHLSDSEARVNTFLQQRRVKRES